MLLGILYEITFDYEYLVLVINMIYQLLSETLLHQLTLSHCHFFCYNNREMGMKMNRFNSALTFKGKWRTFQKRSLDQVQAFLCDKKIHLVAAPGSGKTTLGIEIIRQIGHAALILVPSIAIRQQWVSRINESFLTEQAMLSDWVSTSLKQPSVITIVTYQAFYSAYSQYVGLLEDDEDDLNELVDYANFDLNAMFKKFNIETICLDEAHHLRTEWWKSLDATLKMQTKIQTISLTATPPYDSSPQQWERYLQLCGPIDLEIFSPELVHEGSLCPHQDYVYLSYPTLEELKSIEQFKDNAQACINQILELEYFSSIIMSHQGLQSPETFDFLETPEAFTSWLVVLNYLHLSYPHYLDKLIGKKKYIPRFNQHWFELFLQSLLFTDKENFIISQSQHKEIMRVLKQYGCLDHNIVCLTSTKKLASKLTSSSSKLNSIVDITKHEYSNLNQNLRLLILCDYIKKEQSLHIGDETTKVLEIGAIPIFELLRRQQMSGLKLAVLTGSIVIIHQDASKSFTTFFGDQKIHITPILKSDYVQVRVKQNNHKMVQAITHLFEQGDIHVLIGTKSLLGEGWDSPCINSLIMASFVGSFMLSNQMRGRAIRKDPVNPRKVSNIWHLICVQKPTKESPTANLGISEDYSMMTRRFKSFLGLHYHQPIIENGISRIDTIKLPFTLSNVNASNKATLEMSSKREELALRWKETLAQVDPSFEINEAIIINKKTLPTSFGYIDYMLVLLLSTFIYMGQVVLRTVLRIVLQYQSHLISLFVTLIIVLVSLSLSVIAVFLYKQMTPKKRMKNLAIRIQEALIEKGEVSNHSRVNVIIDETLMLRIELQHASTKEQSIFISCLNTFFGEVDNPRYFMMRGYFSREYYPVPDYFSKRKEDATAFASKINQFTHRYRLVYSRNPKGRQLLLRARAKSFINRNERIIDHKKKIKSRYQ